jgi:hypothetical protein
MTTTEICNLALSHLGDTRITDFHETSVLGEKCRTHYDHERRAVLRAHRWNFAEAAVVLSALTEPPPFGYAYQYQLPADFLRLLEVNGAEASMSEPAAWRIRGNVLLLQAEQANVLYTKDTTNSGLYDPLFVTALSHKLASSLAMAITNGSADRNTQLQLYEMAMKDAGWVDAVENKPRVIPPWQGSGSIMARLHSGRGYYGRHI